LQEAAEARAAALEAQRRKQEEAREAAAEAQRRRQEEQARKAAEARASQAEAQKRKQVGRSSMIGISYENAWSMCEAACAACV
jgi:hypothetical protein